MSKKQSIILVTLMIIVVGFILFLVLDDSTPGLQLRPNQTEQDPDDSAALADQDNESQLTVQAALSDEEFALLKQWNDGYIKRHPNLTVSIENIPQDTMYDQYKKASRLGETADIMLMDNDMLAEFAALGYLQALDAYFPDERQNEIHSELMKQVKWSGYIWGIPKDMNPYVLVWNPDRLLEYGYSDLPVTAEEWQELMISIGPDDVSLYVSDEDPLALLTLLWAFGDSFSVDDHVSISIPESSESMLLSFIEEGLSQPDWEQENENASDALPSKDPWQDLIDGRIMFYLTDLASYLKQNPSTLRIANIPRFISNSNEFAPVSLKGRSYVVSSNSKLPQEAAEWILEMNEEMRQVQQQTISGYLPVYTTYFRKEPFVTHTQYPVLSNAVLNARALSFDPRLHQKLEEVKLLQTQVKQGERSADKLIESIQHIWQQP